VASRGSAVASSRRSAGTSPSRTSGADHRPVGLPTPAALHALRKLLIILEFLNDPQHSRLREPRQRLRASTRASNWSATFHRSLPLHTTETPFAVCQAETRFAGGDKIMSRPITTVRRTLKTVAALGLTVLMAACDDSGRGRALVAPTPVPTPTPPPAAAVGGTLSGFVFEQADNGRVPVARVWVYCDACGPLGHTGMYTDDNGGYTLEGAPAGGTLLLLAKAGYKLPRPDFILPTNSGYMGGMNAAVNGDSRFDIEIVRQ
jgi:hypothetical protein